MKYNLDHLTQPDTQEVFGPIQDDEALALFALVKCMRIRNVVEVGSFAGYSARNFLKAVGENGHVIGVDINQTPKLADNHTTIIKDISLVAEDEIPWEIDLVFYDCHNLQAQMSFHLRMVEFNKITKRTTIVLHDTNLYPRQMGANCYKVRDGWVHQQDERKMVNLLVEQGWSAICLHTKSENHDHTLPFRHGITILQQFNKLET
jgi:hypothetical protein